MSSEPVNPVRPEGASPPSPEAGADQVTMVLAAIRRGEAGAADKLLPLVYDQLRYLARAKMGRLPPGVTLQPTALVHEAYIRLIDRAGVNEPGGTVGWNDRGHFFATAARAMRDILVEQARRRGRIKRGGGLVRESLEAVADETPAIDAPHLDDAGAPDITELSRALDKLETLDKRKAEVMMLAFFAGLTHEQIALAMDISVPTVERDVRFAKAWLAREMKSAGAE